MRDQEGGGLRPEDKRTGGDLVRRIRRDLRWTVTELCCTQEPKGGRHFAVGHPALIHSPSGNKMARGSHEAKCGAGYRQVLVLSFLPALLRKQWSIFVTNVSLSFPLFIVHTPKKTPSLALVALRSNSPVDDDGDIALCAFSTRGRWKSRDGLFRAMEYWGRNFEGEQRDA